MNHESDATIGIFSFQISQTDLGPLFIDILGLDCDTHSPLSAALAECQAGSAETENELRKIAKDENVKKAAEILARPAFIMVNRTGGGSLPLSFFTACFSPETDNDAFAVVTPSFEGSYMIQLFENPWIYLAWWLDLNASKANERVANYIPPPISFESFVYLLHTIDAFRRSAYDGMLNYAPTEYPLMRVEAFTDSLKASIRSGDMRWLLPAFLGLTPGLDMSSFDETPEHFKPLAKLDFLLPTKNEDGTDDLLVFGEAGKIMGVEFYRTWFQSTGFEISVRAGEEWQIAGRGFLAPTGMANHLTLVDPDQAGGYPINHQALTREMLDSKLARLLTDAFAVMSPETAASEKDGVDLIQPAEQTQSAPIPTPSAAHCPNCGQKAKPDDNFCITCGSRLK
ncbi:MAG: zinc ribbon domain-containing protein [Deltaproteobacteria bacterium]|nr:zinc ribbon domain-containing protein [Deltaproteobacteria bacterium]